MAFLEPGSDASTGRLAAARSPDAAARAARRDLARLARPVGDFDPRRYFRGDVDLQFYNVGTQKVRGMAKSIHRTGGRLWSVDEALRFADILITDPHLEVKGIGIELLALHHRAFAPRLLPAWKRWLAEGCSSNWATTDAICGLLLGPLLVAHPALVTKVGSWSRDRSLWVRRASIVALIRPLRAGFGLDEVYEVAHRLHGDREDLIQKAVGWVLREAGKADAGRLAGYLREQGPEIPRTTLRYAIERFSPAARRDLLASTRVPRS